MRVSDLTEGGVTYRALRQRLRDGSMAKVRHGAVVEGGLSPDGRRRQLELLEGTLPVLSGDTWVLSHTTAVAVLGLPMMRDGAGSVWITRPPRSGRHRRAALITRACEMDPDELVLVNGLRVTSPERTALDMAREFGFVTGVTIADAVLSGGVSRDRLELVMDRGRMRPGSRTARRVVCFADGAVESPGESMMRALLHEEGCPDPVLQFKLFTPWGRFVSRNDFGWPEYKVVGEYDGPEKYGRLLKPGQSVSDVVVSEKEREADIRDQGYQIARFSTTDLRFPKVAAARVMRLLERGRV